jgi:hypothetical protein
VAGVRHDTLVVWQVGEFDWDGLTLLLLELVPCGPLVVESGEVSVKAGGWKRPED